MPGAIVKSHWMSGNWLGQPTVGGMRGTARIRPAVTIESELKASVTGPTRIRPAVTGESELKSR